MNWNLQEIYLILLIIFVVIYFLNFRDIFLLHSCAVSKKTNIPLGSIVTDIVGITSSLYLGALGILLCGFTQMFNIDILILIMFASLTAGHLVSKIYYKKNMDLEGYLLNHRDTLSKSKRLVFCVTAIIVHILSYVIFILSAFQLRNVLNPL